MLNPLLDVPLNTKQLYVRATTPSGCQIIMPVDTDDEDVVDATKLNLQIYLNKTYPLPEPEDPRVA